jgi:membrane protein DedA with SNARE-associated domain
MPSLDAALHLLQAHGLVLVFLLAMVEGPIVTVLAAYLARLGNMDIVAVFVVVVLADLVGDAGLYLIGRYGHGGLPPRWRKRLGLDEKRQDMLDNHFRQSGGRTLILGKLTHSAGMLVLLAAGASRMRFGPFLFYNLVGTLPKSLFFLLIGYTLGYAYTAIDSYIFRASLTVLVLILLAGLYWLLRRRGQRA